MNKNELINEVSCFIVMNDYDPNSITVTHGGAMVLLGRRETTNDIDMNVSEDIFEAEMVKGGKVTHHKDGIKRIQTTPIISIQVGWEKTDFKRREQLGGWWCMGERELYQEYKKLNRDKDQETLVKLSAIIAVKDKYNLD